jgi:ABC-type enterochelin transport system ATPase subunit
MAGGIASTCSAITMTESQNLERNWKILFEVYKTRLSYQLPNMLHFHRYPAIKGASSTDEKELITWTLIYSDLCN